MNNSRWDKLFGQAWQKGFYRAPMIVSCSASSFRGLGLKSNRADNWEMGGNRMVSLFWEPRGKQTDFFAQLELEGWCLSRQEQHFLSLALSRAIYTENLQIGSYFLQII